MAGNPDDARLLPQVAATLIAHMLTMANGFNLGWPAVALPVLESNGTTVDPNPLGTPLTKDEASWVASAMILVSAFTPPLYSEASTRWGRKAAGYLAAAPFLLSGTILVFGRSLPTLLVGRVLAGVASGGTLASAPHFVAEIAQEKHRGAMSSVLAIELNTGILIAYIAGAAAGYRTVCALCIALPAIFTAAWMLLPETPQYLLSRGGRDQDALRSLRWLRGPDYDVEGELQRMKAAAVPADADRAGSKASLADFFRDRASRRAFITVLVVITNLQLCGYLIVVNYAVELFAAAGTGVPPAWSAVVVGTLQLAAAALTSQLVDRAGRRPLLLATNAAIAACLAALGGYFYAQSLGADVHALWWLPIASLSLFVVCCNLGIASIAFVLLSELYAPYFAPIAISIGIPILLISAFGVLKIYVYLLAWLDIHGSYWLFAASMLACNVYIYFCLPETKGRPITDIVAELAGGSTRREAYDPVAQR